MRHLLVALTCAIALAGHAAADGYPDRPIKVILPYTPGSPNDVVARLIGPPASVKLGQPLVIENRPGGGTSIGVKGVLAAEPDGYTLLFTNSPTHFILPIASKTVGYEPLKDFVPIAAVASGGLMLVIAPEVPANTVREFAAYAKANPGKINFGFGQGTLPQLIGEMFKHAAGAQTANIPYKGGSQAIPDILGGRIQMNIGTISTLAPLVRQGKLRALAVTSHERNPQLPEVPTMAESGFPSVELTSTYGLFGPAGMPKEAIDRVNAAVNETLKETEVRAAIARIGFDPHGGTPEDFAKLLASEMKIWIPIVRQTGFQLN